MLGKGTKSAMLEVVTRSNLRRSLCDLPEAYKQEITFTLNDICACTLARTALILYFLYKGK